MDFVKNEKFLIQGIQFVIAHISRGSIGRGVEICAQIGGRCLHAYTIQEIRRDGINFFRATFAVGDTYQTSGDFNAKCIRTAIEIAADQWVDVYLTHVARERLRQLSIAKADGILDKVGLDEYKMLVLKFE